MINKVNQLTISEWTHNLHPYFETEIEPLQSLAATLQCVNSMWRKNSLIGSSRVELHHPPKKTSMKEFGEVYLAFMVICRRLSVLISSAVIEFSLKTGMQCGCELRVSSSLRSVSWPVPVLRLCDATSLWRQPKHFKEHKHRTGTLLVGCGKGCLVLVFLVSSKPCCLPWSLYILNPWLVVTSPVWCWNIFSCAICCCCFF